MAYLVWIDNNGVEHVEYGTFDCLNEKGYVLKEYFTDVRIIREEG